MKGLLIFLEVIFFALAMIYEDRTWSFILLAINTLLLFNEEI